MTKFTSSRKKRISKDWAAGLASMSVWKPMRLLRRHGPLLFGLCLDRTRDPAVYLPRVHFHCLAVEFPTISLALVQDVMHGTNPWYVKNRDHDSSLGELIAAATSQFPQLTRAELSFNDFAKRTSDYLQSNPHPYLHGPYQNLVVLAAYCGYDGYARAALDEFATRMGSWPEGALHIIKSPEAWRDRLLPLVEMGTDLSMVVNSEVSEHKLDGLPDLTLSTEGDPIRIWE